MLIAKTATLNSHTCSEIAERLFLGSVDVGSSNTLLEKLGTTAVVNLTQTKHELEGVRVLHCPVEDTLTQRIEGWIETAQSVYRDPSLFGRCRFRHGHLSFCDLDDLFSHDEEIFDASGSIATRVRKTSIELSTHWFHHAAHREREELAKTNTVATHVCHHGSAAHVSRRAGFDNR